MAAFGHEDLPDVTVMTLLFRPSVPPIQAPAQRSFALISITLDVLQWQSIDIDPYDQSCWRRCLPPPPTRTRAIHGPNPHQAPPTLIHPLPSGVGWAWVPSHWRHVGAKSPQPHPISRSFFDRQLQGPTPFSTVPLPNQASRTSPAHLVLVTTTKKLPSAIRRFQTLRSFFQHWLTAQHHLASSTCPVLAKRTGSPSCITASTPLGRINFVRHGPWGVKSSTQPTFHHSQPLSSNTSPTTAPNHLFPW